MTDNNKSLMQRIRGAASAPNTPSPHSTLLR